MSDQQEDAFVYIIAPLQGVDFVAPVKVGLSSSPSCRLDTIQTAAPFKLGIYHAFTFPNRDIAREVEIAFHKVLRRHRTHGEWFNLAPKAAFYHMAANIRWMLKRGLEMPEEEIRPSVIYSIFSWVNYQ